MRHRTPWPRQMQGVLAAALILSGGALAAQAPVLGPDQGAPTVRWRTVEGTHVRVITPDTRIAEAQRLAALIDRIAARDTASLRARAPRIDLVMRHQLAQANAFVTLMPRRTEFFLQPPQGEGLLGSGDWLTLLAVHEYRHVKQFSAARQGFTKLASTLFGEPAWATLAFWSIPPGTGRGTPRSPRRRSPRRGAGACRALTPTSGRCCWSGRCRRTRPS